MSSNLFIHQVVPQNATISPVENLAVEVGEAFDKLHSLIGSKNLVVNFSDLIGQFLLNDIQYHGFSKDVQESISAEDSNLELSYSVDTNFNINASYMTGQTETVLTLVQPNTSFSGVNQFKVSGKLITLSNDLSGKTIKFTYKGLVNGFNNIKPNVIQDTNGYIKDLVKTATGVYTVSYNINVQEDVLKLFTRDPQSSLVYLISTKDSNYEIIPYEHYSINNNNITFNIEDSYAEDVTSVIVFVLNSTVTEFITSLYKEFINHSHGKNSFNRLIEHSSLLNNYKNTAKIYYKQLDIDNYPHPQYLNREGYNPSLVSAYENALLGDLFLSATITAEDQTYKTLSKNSYKILFGDPVVGSKLYYDTTLKSLNVLAGVADNGLNISVALDKKALSINNNSSYISENSTGTIIKGVKNTVLIGADVNEQSTLQADNLISTKTADFNNVITNTFSIGDVIATSKDGITTYSSTEDNKTSSIVYDLKTFYRDLYATSATLETAFLKTSLKTSETSALKNTNGVFEFNLEGNYLNILQKTGKTSGLQIGSSQSKYKIFTSNSLGEQATSEDSNLFIETASSNSLYLLKDTLTRKLDRGFLYSFQRDEVGSIRRDSLKEWVRADLFSGNINSYSIKVDATSSKAKNGIVIGRSTTLSSIGEGLDCPAGTTILESADAFHVIKPLPDMGDTLKCSSVSYQNLNAGNTQVFGELAVDQSIFTPGNITSNDTVSSSNLDVSNVANISRLNIASELNVSGPANITAATSIANTLNVTGSITSQSSLAATDATFSRGVLIGRDLNVDGQTNLNDSLNVKGSINTTNDFSTQGTIRSTSLSTGDIQASDIFAKGSLNLTGNLATSGTTTLGGNTIIVGNIDNNGNFTTTGEITGDSLYITTDSKLMGRLYVEGPVDINTDSFSVGSNNSIISLNGSLNVTGQNTILTSNVQVQGTLKVSNVTTISNDLNVTGVASITQLNVGSTVTIGGNLKADSGEFTRKVYFTDGIKTANTSEFTQLTANVGSIKEFNTETLFVKSSLSMGPDAKVIADKVETNSINQKDASATSSFKGKVDFSDRLTINGDTGIVIGSPDIVSTRFTSGCWITDNSIIMGNNSVVKAVKVFANKGTPLSGNKDLNAGFCFATSDSNGGEDGDTGLFSTVGDGSGLDSSDLEIWIDGARKYAFKKEDVAYDADVNTYGKSVVTVEMLKKFEASIRAQISGAQQSAAASAYPVGSLFITTSDQSPRALLGFGVWERYAMGRTLIGRATPDNPVAGGLSVPYGVNVYTTGSAFGEYEHQLTVEEMPSHSHDFRLRLEGFNGGWNIENGSGNEPQQDEGYIKPTGGDRPHNNTQPSIVVNIWRRLSDDGSSP